ncbi:unnamed protein product, partial [Polarella glacialis]
MGLPDGWDLRNLQAVGSLDEAHRLAEDWLRSPCALGGYTVAQPPGADLEWMFFQDEPAVEALCVTGELLIHSTSGISSAAPSPSRTRASDFNPQATTTTTPKRSSTAQDSPARGGRPRCEPGEQLLQQARAEAARQVQGGVAGGMDEFCSLPAFHGHVSQAVLREIWRSAR